MYLGVCWMMSAFTDSSDTFSKAKELLLAICGSFLGSAIDDEVQMEMLAAFPGAPNNER